ncbi:MAG TPA: hypothetical protein VKK79_20620 [Candidatus Lokiarchaeia archaeon]|nr:hypothetical protein [Candidatus Lokiarchaeia archaeon]
MDQLKLKPEEQKILARDGQVKLFATKPTNLYRFEDKLLYCNRKICVDLGSACRICKGNCCENTVILSPLEMYEIANHTDQKPSEFCSLVPVPDYVQELKDYHDVYFNVDKGVICLFIGNPGAEEERCNLCTPTGCTLPEEKKPSTCKVFPFNYESTNAMWEAGIKDPSVIEFYIPEFNKENRDFCLFIEMFTKKPVFAKGYDFLLKAMKNDPADVRFSAWKFLRGIQFWNDVIYPLIEDGDDVDKIYDLIQANYDEVAIYGKSLEDARREWFGTQ